MSDLNRNRPSDEAYESAKNANRILYNSIATTNERLMTLIDEIISERKQIANCEKMIANNKKVILAYELFKEMEEKEESRE